MCRIRIVLGNAKNKTITKNCYISIMRRDNIKIEIQKIIDKVPDDMLEDIYNILKDFAGKSPDSIKLSHNLNKVLNEDKGLLERLAK
jgi:uncharacterized protein YjcR